MQTVQAFLARHPRWVVAIVLAFGLLVLGASLYTMGIQIGDPYPGFFYTPDRIVSSYSLHDATGWQAGLRPWDRILAVDGQHPNELSRLVQEAGIGGIVTYTVERDSQTLQFAVPTMEFTADILLGSFPPYVLYSVLCFALGLFVYWRDPGSRLGQYLLMYLVLWGAVTGPNCEYFASQVKWSAWVFHPWIATICVSGWIFFWSFPADRARVKLLARWRLVRSFALFGMFVIACFLVLYALAQRLDQRWTWNLYTLAISWVAFILLAGGSAINKGLPLLRIIRRKGVDARMRRQALVLLVGISVGLGGVIIWCWIPFGLHGSPPWGPPWPIGAVLGIVYPLAIAYAVLRYQLFDIQVVVRKGLIYSLLTAALTAIFLLLALLTGYLFQALTGQQSLLVAILPALLVAFLFQPARSRIQTFVDRAFFRQQYEARHAMAAFTGELGTLRDREEVVRLVLDTVQGTLGAGSSVFYLADAEGGYRPAGNGAGQPMPPESALPGSLIRQPRPLVAVPDSTAPEIEELRKAGLRLAAPLFAGDRLLGILALGEKRSGQLYTQADQEMLMTLAQGAALALENARLHQERLAIMRQQLAQVTVAQEEERQRIARELHDGVGPALASMNLRLRAVHSLLGEEEPAAAELEEIAEMATGHVRDIRRLIYDLRPAALDELGLVPALRDYLLRRQREQGLVIDFRATHSQRLPAPVETALFRIAQEAVNNAIKHAATETVAVTLTRANGGVQLCVADDGRGFEPHAPRSSRHVGLWSMRERVEQLGGDFQVRSAPGQGTTLTAWVPLNLEEEPWTPSAS